MKKNHNEIERLSQELLENSILVNEILEYIRENHPEQQTFKFDQHTVKVLSDSIRNGDYFTISSSFGINYLLCILRFFESREDYEECSIIMLAVDKEKALKETIK